MSWTLSTKNGHELFNFLQNSLKSTQYILLAVTNFILPGVPYTADTQINFISFLLTLEEMKWKWQRDAECKFWM